MIRRRPRSLRRLPEHASFRGQACLHARKPKPMGQQCDDSAPKRGRSPLSSSRPNEDRWQAISEFQQACRSAVSKSQPALASWRRLSANVLRRSSSRTKCAACLRYASSIRSSVSTHREGSAFLENSRSADFTGRASTSLRAFHLRGPSGRQRCTRYIYRLAANSWMHSRLALDWLRGTPIEGIANLTLRSSPQGLLAYPFPVFGRDMDPQSFWSSVRSSRDVGSTGLRGCVA
jgi:hypothetical protein